MVNRGVIKHKLQLGTQPSLRPVRPRSNFEGKLYADEPCVKNSYF